MGSSEDVSADREFGALDVHVFERQGKFFAFDARSFSILQLDAVGALVISLMKDHSLPAIRSQLSSLVTHDLIDKHYNRLAELIREGVLSLKPVERPAKPRLTNLVLMMAGGCNMGCSYCFEQDVPIYKKPNLLSVEAADAILAWFFGQHSGTYAHIELYGGEPLLNWNVVEHVVDRLESWAAVNGITLSKYMITNGTLLSPQRAEFLRAHEIEVQVSIDGDKKTHDRNRTMKGGTGTYERVVRGVSHLKAANAPFNLRAVLNRANLSVANIVTSLEQLGADRVSFGVVSSAKAANRLTDDEWAEFLSGYRTYVRTKFSETGAVPKPLQSTVRRILAQHRIHYGCGAGLSEVTVAPDGSVFECQRLMGAPLGSIYNEDMREPKSSFLRQVDDRPECRDCVARYICGGGCKESFVTQTGVDVAFPQWCEMKLLELEESIAIIADLGNKGAVPSSITQTSRGSSSCA